MAYARLPDWLIYVCATGALVMACVSRRENNAQPPAPPPPQGEGAAYLGPLLTFDPSALVDPPKGAGAAPIGTAATLGERGVWYAPAPVVGGCASLALLASPGQGVALKWQAWVAGGALARFTVGGGPAPMTTGPSPHVGQRAFAAGFPSGQPGEVSLSYIGRQLAAPKTPGGARVALDVWAETGRTQMLRRGLQGLEGAVVVDPSSRALGLVVGQNERRGEIYSVAAGPPARRPSRDDIPAADPVTVENYGRAADGFRRELKVAPLICVKPHETPGSL